LGIRVYPKGILALYLGIKVHGNLTYGIPVYPSGRGLSLTDWDLSLGEGGCGIGSVPGR
jgi:hypothetical protein